MNFPLMELVLHGREERSLEYKCSLDWKQPECKGKLTKAILALANIRDGGAIVIGVEQQGEAFVSTGMSQPDYESFKQDDVAEWVNGHADPFAEITVSRLTHNGKSFVVIQVAEFSEIPVVCKQNGPSNLRRGAIYTRARRKIETVEVPTQAEMRELLEIAVDKGVRKLMERFHRAGLLSSAISGQPDHRQEFHNQLGGL